MLNFTINAVTLDEGQEYFSVTNTFFKKYSKHLLYRNYTTIYNIKIQKY